MYWTSRKDDELWKDLLVVRVRSAKEPFGMHFQVCIVTTRSGAEASLMLARPLHTCEKCWKNPVSAPQRVGKMFGRTERLDLDTRGDFSECEEKKKLWERGTAERHERETERKTLLRRRGAERLRC